jgi:hypothetical protein
MIGPPNTTPSGGKEKDIDSSSDIHQEDASDLSESSEHKRENSSSADDTSNTSPHSSSNGSSSGRKGFGLFQSSKDDRHINGAKCVFLAFLLATAICLSVTIYFTTASNEQGDFQVNVSAARYEGVCSLFLN